MRPNQSVGLVYLESAKPKASAKIYEFTVRQTESRGHRRVKALERENIMLMRVLSETRTEIARLRELLTTS